MAPVASGRIIAVDAMGGDNGASAVVAAAVLAFKAELPLDKLVLVGQQDVLTPLVNAAGLSGEPRLEIVHASEVIGMDEKPKTSYMKKKDSSMARTIGLLKDGRVNAAVSCGNTGSLVFHATLMLRLLDGITKPAIATVIPTKTSYFVLIDSGANPVAKAENLMHNAILGSWYAKVVLGLKSPRVGLLSIGTEEGKGNDLTRESHELLKAINGTINYIGMVEGLQLFEGNGVDVVVCDGFVGNIVLKTCEGLAKMVKHFLEDRLRATPVRLVGAALSRGAFKEMKQRMNPDQYGGAPLLGLNGNLLKAHGSASSAALFSAIRVATDLVTHDLNSQVVIDVARANSTGREVALKQVEQSRPEPVNSGA
ncbi:MAG: phosphate acyltransferase PlsX [Verrucomicrobiota bacterium]|nr:phosphate acyltransferase PlsX [Verrucomicrobiota bacterium]